MGADDLTPFQALLTGYHLFPGSAGPGTTANPLLNLFGRVDISLPSWNSRLVLRHSFGQASAGNLSRGDPSSFPLSSFLYQQRGNSNVSAVQLLTSLPDGGSNELSLNYYVDPIWSVPALRQPEIDVAVASADGEGTVTLTAGMAPFADAFAVHQHSFEANDVARVPMGRSHLLTLGGKAEVFSVGHNLTPAASGWWTFDGLDAFAAGNAATFTTWKDFGGGSSSLSGSQVALFAGDQWQIGRSLSLTGGIRAELPILNQHPPYSPEISAAFGRGSEVMPRQSVLLSPRLGFTWNMGSGSRSVLRGGAGVFTGRPPFALWLSAFDSYGRGVLELDCAEGGEDAAGPAPHFDSTYAHAAHPPQACANGVGFDSTAPRTAYLLDPSITYPQSFRASLAYERSLWRGGDVTLDALYSRMMNEFFFVDRALKGPTGTDAHGRVIYGTFDTTGTAYPDLVDQRFVHAVDMVPQQGAHSWEMSIGVTQLLSTGFTASAAYTHSRVRDAMTMTDPFGFGNLDTHPVAGHVEDQTIGVSDFDLPHRVLVAGTFTAPWKRWRTDVSIFYTGGSGAPFTLTSRRRGGQTSMPMETTSTIRSTSRATWTIARRSPSTGPPRRSPINGRHSGR